MLSMKQPIALLNKTSNFNLLKISSTVFYLSDDSQLKNKKLGNDFNTAKICEKDSYFKSLLKLLKKQRETPMIYTAHNAKINPVNEELLRTLNLNTVEKRIDFSDIGINKYLINLLHEYNITSPYEPQEKSIPFIMKARNVIIESATGSGKTLTFLLPICNSINDEKSCSSVIVVPSRELASQMYKEFMKYTSDEVLVSRHVSGVNEEHDMKLIKALRYSKILIGTPKKLYNIIQENPGYFRNTKRLVLDEVDKLLPMKSLRTKNFLKTKETEKIIAMLKFHQKNVQLIATSATIPRPLVEELQEIGFGKYAKVVRLTPEKFPFGKVPSNIKHNFIQVDDSSGESAPLKLISRLFRASNEKSALVFVERGQSVDKVIEVFKEGGLKAVALYKELLHPTTKGFENFSQAFQCGDIDIVVSTEETMRGMDFPFVSQSYLTYIPDSPASYLHVAGRVGRSAQKSTVTTLINSSDWKNGKRRLKRKYLLLGIKGRLLLV